MSGSMTVVESCAVPAHEAISFPVLTYTDAQPRDDLQAINNVTAPWRANNGKPMRWDFSRPETTDEASTRRLPPGASATFDFQLTAPPDEVISSNTPDRSPVGPHVIGLALGSPSMLQQQEELPPPRFNTSVFASDSAEGTQPTKSNKWKKIGGLFRAKNNLALPVDHARVGWPKHTMTKEKPGTKASKSSQTRFSTEEWPRLEIEKTANNDGHRARDFPAVATEGPSVKPNEGLLLNVNIPDVQMERYSVMFSNVMNRNQRPSLLARRSKTLDNLRIPNTQDFLAPKLPSVPQRRATSPAWSSFTVFPTSQPPKAAQILGTEHFSHGASPLLRSNTLPVESPSKSPVHHPQIFNNSSLSSFESPVISNLFSGYSDTPRSSNTYTRNEDKPLPAIKPDAVSPPRKSSLQVGSPKHTQQPSSRRSEQEAPKRRRPRPDLTIQTQEQAPAPPAKDKPLQPSTKAIMNGIPPTKSPVQLSDRKLALEKHSAPIVTEREIVDLKKSPQVPRIEVSTARSISVSKGKRQMLVPIASRVDQLGSNERFVDRRVLIPRVTDAQYGHRHAVSQELQIESL